MSKKKKKKNKLYKSQPIKVESVKTAASLPVGLPVEKIKYIVGRLNNIATYQDVSHCFHLYDELKKEVQPLLSSKGFEGFTSKEFGMIGVTDIFGYRPQGSQFWNLFPNPFGIFAYLAENHWAVRNCRSEYFKEILSDGYTLVGNRKRFKEFAKVAKHIKLNYLRAVIADHLKIFGNVWIRPERNFIHGIQQFKLLLPHYIRPILTPDGQKIIAWEYQLGNGCIIYGKEQLLHQIYRPSQRHYEIGNPPLGAMLIQIEADIQADMYNNVMFQKGGLMGMAILLDRPVGNFNNSLSSYAQQLQAELSANHAGARTGFDAVVLENTREVKMLNDLSTLDGAFHKGSDKCAKQIAHCMDVPHERLGIITNASQQYHAARFSDDMTEQFDKAVNEITNVTDDFVNTRILPMIGFNDVQIRAKSRYNSLARTATQSGVDLGQLFGVISVNEYRVEFLKLHPIKGGDVMLTKYPAAIPTSPTGSPAYTVIPPPPMKSDDFELQPAIESDIYDTESDLADVNWEEDDTALNGIEGPLD